jgi:adenosylmethionine-8-amino-7-oxononanoate aminotransferase
MAAVELVRDKASKERFPPTAAVSKRIEARCREQGLIVRTLRPHDLVLSPPLVMTGDEATWVTQVLGESLERVEKDLLG